MRRPFKIGELLKAARGHGRRLLWPALAGLCCFVPGRPGQAGEPSSHRYEFTRPQMGLPFRIVLYATDTAAAEAAANAAFDRISQLNDILSDYETDSELNRLSRTAGQGKAVSVSQDLWRVLTNAQALAEKSNGAFDVTAGPYVGLWRKARREKKLPAPSRLAEIQSAVGFRNLRFEPPSHTVELLVPRMKLDLGGIAKGYAVDEALAVLRMRGVTRALVAGGGDMAMSKPPPDKQGWRIEVPLPEATNSPAARYVLLAGAAIATSGDRFQRLEAEGRSYSHIVDPRTGLGLTDHSEVTVIAADCATADSLATALSVLGPEAGLKLIEQTRGTAARIMREIGPRIEVRESRAFKTFCESP